MPSNLSYEVIDAKPQYFDFCRGFGETWDIPLPLTEEERQAEWYVPIYNFLYPLGDGFVVPRDFRRRLDNTTIVETNDSLFLALTGCGQDMSWEIAASYVNLGFYPPAHFSRLPQMAGRGTSLSDRRIAFACATSLEALVGRYQRDAQWVRQTYLP